MPGLIGKKQKQKKLIANLAEEFFTVKKQHDLVLGDFPDVRATLRMPPFLRPRACSLVGCTALEVKINEPATLNDA